LPYPEWRSLLREYSQKSDDERFYASLRLFLGSVNPFGQTLPRFDHHLTQELIKEGGVFCPKIDKKLIEIYLNYFCQSGYISRPVSPLSLKTQVR
jgi:hypothetical protein